MMRPSGSGSLKNHHHLSEDRTRRLRTRMGMLRKHHEAAQEGPWIYRTTRGEEITHELLDRNLVPVVKPHATTPDMPCDHSLQLMQFWSRFGPDLLDAMEFLLLVWEALRTQGYDAQISTEHVRLFQEGRRHVQIVKPSQACLLASSDCGGATSGRLSSSEPNLSNVPKGQGILKILGDGGTVDLLEPAHLHVLHGAMEEGRLEDLLWEGAELLYQVRRKSAGLKVEDVDDKARADLRRSRRKR